MSTFKQAQGTHTSAVTSGGSVSNGVTVAANGASNILNSSNLDEVVAARLTAGFGSAPTEGGTLGLYLVPKLDGATLADIDTGGTIPVAYWVGNFYIAKNATPTQIMDIWGIQIDAYDYAPYITNSSGQTMSSGWKLDFYGSVNQY